MKIFSSEQIRNLDNHTIQNQNITSLDLMERASNAFVQWLSSKYKKNYLINIFTGPGNNGGDGLAVARLLINKGYNINVFTVLGEKTSPDYKTNLKRLNDLTEVKIITDSSQIPYLPEGALVIDALFGSGINKPLNGIFAELVNKINHSKSNVISIDIASGLFSDQNTPPGPIIEPKETVSFQLPKLAFFLPQNFKYVGEWSILDIGSDSTFMENEKTNYHYLQFPMVKNWIKKRTKFSHKGDFGRSLIIAGSYGMIGAAVLAVKACYRSGAGLVRAYIPKCGYDIFQTVLPEAMVITDPHMEQITAIPDISLYSAIGVGPGISEGPETVEALKKLLKCSTKPLVVDAGAINILGANRELLSLLPENSILTPHPKEFERLTGKYENEFDRLEGVKKFSCEYKSYLILKGAHTAIACPDGSIYFNSTGNPGMATGGSGDVLTGIITGLLSQSYTPHEAALTGVFMHGFAGDVASQLKSVTSIMATDIIEGINEFYKTAEVT